MPDCLQDYARKQVRLGHRVLEPGADRGVAAMLTCASWLLAQLPHKVVERQRAELVRTLQEARNLVVEVQCSPAPVVRVRDGQRLWWRFRLAGEAESAFQPRAIRSYELSKEIESAQVERPGTSFRRWEEVESRPSQGGRTIRPRSPIAASRLPRRGSACP